MTEQDYSERLSKYTNTIKAAINVSRFAAGKQAEDRLVWACVLYTKICVTGVSILILSPNSGIAEKKIPHWDFSSLFSLTRNIMECYQTFYYLCIDKVSEDEFKARRQLFNLHDYYSRRTLLSFASENIENKEVEQEIINKLTNTAYFKNLDPKQQKHFLKGNNPFFINREEIETKMGNDKNNFKLLYKLFSSNTHSYPMGFYGMLEEERGTGVKSEVEIGYNALALEVAEYYVREAAKKILNIFPEISKKLTKEERQHLE
jgi:chorismate mutase